MEQLGFISGNPKICLCGWFGNKNFGDELGLYLFERLTGNKAKPEYTPGCVMLATIGSIVSCTSLASPTIFWGSGILQEQYASQIIKEPPFYSKNRRFYALRGSLSAAVLFDQAHYRKETDVFGDPAILMPYVYQAKPSSTRYELGIICHHSQNIEPLQRLVADKYGAKVRVISISREGDEQIEQCIDEICSCDKIASTSLHGIVVAQAYGIPALLIQDLTQPIEGHSFFKFADYYLGTNQKPQMPLKFNDYEQLINAILPANFVTPPNFRSLCQNLLDVFPLPDLLKIKQLPY